MKKIKMLFMLVMVLLLAACGTEKEVDLRTGTFEQISYEETNEITNYLKIEMKNNNLILLELYPDLAPITVANFQALVVESFFDGTKFHRVVKGFMIQAGISPKDEIAETIKGEFLNNGIENTLLHERGVISMARTSASMDSASSQFFIMHQKSTSLDGDYAAFGKVIAGMDTVDKIANTVVDEPKSMAPKPIVDQVIRSIRFINIED